MTKSKQEVFDLNIVDAALDLVGSKSSKRIKTTEKNKKDFQIQYTPHSICGCYGCVELAKIFVVKSHDIREKIITISMQDLQTK